VCRFFVLQTTLKSTNMEWNLFKLGLAVLLMCLWRPSCILGQTSTSECSLETNSGYIYILLIFIDFYNMSIIYYSKVIAFTWYSCSKIDDGKAHIVVQLV